MSVIGDGTADPHNVAGDKLYDYDLILLDLNMPRMDGRTALQHLKADDKLRKIPVIVLTTSQAEEDISKTYGLGVSSFISKPVGFEGLVEVVQAIGNYWIQIVALPPTDNEAA